MKYYHGTTRINAEKILQNGFRESNFIIFNIVRNSKIKRIKVPGSLGYGTYVFIDDSELALQFGRKFSNDPVVLEVAIDLHDEDNILDLTNSKIYKQFQKFASIAQQAESASSIFKEFYKQKAIRGTAQDVYAGIMTELFILYLRNEKNIDIRFVKKDTETLLPPNDKGYQRLGLPNGTELTIRYPRQDVKNIKVKEWLWCE